MKKEAKKIKLLQKTSKAFLIISAILMLTSTVVLYFYVNSLLLEEIEDELYSVQDRVVYSISENNKFLSLPPLVEVNEVAVLKEGYLRDTLLYDHSQDDIELFRELSTFKHINGRNYQITVRSLVVETIDIVIAVVVSYAVIILLAFLLLFYFNKSWNKKLWRPFFANLQQMRNFSLQSDKPIQLVESEIEEFSELNEQIASLVNKVQKDYENLKQYTEDVSHEIQTPLAIIQAKIENTINEKNISEESFESLASIQQDIKRLTQLNKRLTILTKIENNQFTGLEEIDLGELIDRLIENYKELSPTEITFSAENELKINADPYLAELLCSNLLSNAIKHGTKNQVLVKIIGKTLSVSNLGESAYEDPEKLFERFYRDKKSIKKSTGLGLAIVKKICDYYNFMVRYEFEKQHHTFYLTFR